VVIGDLVQQGVTQSDYSLTGATLVILTMSLLVVGTAWVGFRFCRLRPVLEGEPVIVIADGKILEHNLHRQRMTIEELLPAGAGGANAAAGRLGRRVIA
jgi:uncharacterized membrane protein YcaP (DUF421 family)